MPEVDLSQLAIDRSDTPALPLASRFRSELPDDLITLLAQLLRFNAADRPQNFNDLQRQLACLH